MTDYEKLYSEELRKPEHYARKEKYPTGQSLSVPGAFTKERKSIGFSEEI